MRLLMHQWAQGEIPKETQRLSRIVTSLGSSWDIVRLKFVETETGLINEKLEEIRQERMAYLKKQQENGKKGGRKPKINPTLNPNTNPNQSLHNEDEYEVEDENEVEVEKEKKKASVKIEIDNPFGPAGARMWDGWKTYKREEHRKAYKSERTEQQAINHLYELSAGSLENASKIIQQSIANQWQGLFPLKTQSNGRQHQTTSLRDDVQAEFNRRYGKS